ncbi:MAG: glycerophosphodiester phosphodiesterase [Fusobacteriaceae bacterium]|jgi:glycerophosphoryl diester phosphodiesterase|nr:glycerophosphodiester phosphodiesterase [Fusobacteriaceae bacterium]
MKIFAHRGYSGRYPENTMLAFEKAADTRCDGIELDVQLTKDGEVVIIHDERVDRTTDGAGFVRDLTLAEIQKLNAAKRGLSMEKPAAYAFQSVPSFEEYCAWAAGQALVTNIELKTSVYYYRGIEEKTLALVTKYGLENRVLFSSFNHLSVMKIRELAPGIPCGALTDGEGIGQAGAYCDNFGLAYYHPDVRKLTEEVVDECRRWKIGVNVWTVNRKKQVEKLSAWGCEGVITNYPAEVMGWVALKE